MTLTFTIPAAPGVNNLYANVPGRGRVKSERYRTWINAAGWAMRECAGRWDIFAAPVEITIINGNRRLDCDAPAKPVIDLLKHMAVIADDNHRHVHRVVCEYGGNPRECVVIVREIAETMPDARHDDDRPAAGVAGNEMAGARVTRSPSTPNGPGCGASVQQAAQSDAITRRWGADGRSDCQAEPIAKGPLGGLDDAPAIPTEAALATRDRMLGGRQAPR